MAGRYARLEPLNQSHVPELFAAYAEDKTGETWDYMPVGPFVNEADYAAWAQNAIPSADPMFFAVRGEDGMASGVASFLRIDRSNGSIEVGYIAFAPKLQRTRAASEAIILMARLAFDLGYRRFEWKCNALNAPSRRAASRYGFSYEGVFRQAAVIKGRNRDTAWFAMIDAERPALDAAWAQWLDPANFDENGHQLTSLADLTRPILAAPDPSRH